MARDFDGSADKLDRTSAVISGQPLTMACWFNSDTITVSQTLMGVSTAGTANNRFTLQASGATTGDPVRFIAKVTAGASRAATSTGYSAGTWHHACGVAVSINDRRVFIDGGSKNTQTSTRDPSGMDRTSIGVGVHASDVNFMDGRIAEAAIWNIALSDAEVALLAQFVSPLLIRPDALVAYWPIIGRFAPEIDRWGGFDMTVTSAPPAAAHLRVFYPAGISAMGVPVAAVVDSSADTVLFTFGQQQPRFDPPEVVGY